MYQEIFLATPSLHQIIQKQIYRNEVLVFLENTFCPALSILVEARKLSAY